MKIGSGGEAVETMGHKAQTGGGSDDGQKHGHQGSQHAEIWRHLPRPVAVPSRVSPVTATRQLNGLRHTAADGADHRTLNHLTHTRHQGWVLSVLAGVGIVTQLLTADHRTLNHHTHTRHQRHGSSAARLLLPTWVLGSPF